MRSSPIRRAVVSLLLGLASASAGATRLAEARTATPQQTASQQTASQQTMSRQAVSRQTMSLRSTLLRSISPRTVARQTMAASLSATEYANVLEAYRLGEPDALDRLAAFWRTDNLDPDLWESLAGEQLPLAIVAHLDLAARNLAPPGSETGTRHLAIAERIARARVMREPRSEAGLAARRGYFLLAVWLANGMGDLTIIGDRLRVALGALSEDPEVMLAQGSYEELLADPGLAPEEPEYLMDLPPSPLEPEPGPRPPMTRAAAVAALRPGPRRAVAGRWFRRVIERQLAASASAADPGGVATMIEARVRLARLAILDQRWDGARDELAQVRETLSRLDGSVRQQVRRLEYLAHLFAAKSSGHADDWAGAVDAYRLAAVLCPAAQAAHLGMSHAYWMAGSVEDARREARMALELAPRPDARVTVGRVGVPPVCAGDPWADYNVGQRWRVDQLLAELRTAVRR